MKQISTLTICLFLLVNVTFAQYTQYFDATTSLTTGCSLVSGALITTSTGEPITGTGSLTSNPPVNGSGTRDYATPYLTIGDIANPTATLNVSFNYKLNEALNGQSTRTIEFGLQDKNGVFISLHTIVMNKEIDPTTATQFIGSYPGVQTGIKRLVIKMAGAQGDNARIIIDDLSVVGAQLYYSNSCNSAPLAKNDAYTASLGGIYTSIGSVTSNDSDPNGETLSAPVIATQSPDGTVVMNADGTFTFTPAAGFTGTSTTFTYSVSDNGFDIATSTAIVTLNFVAAAPLPIKLLSFSGSLVNKKAQLSWSVADNETGERFEIEKSSDGRSFTNAGIMFTSSKIGTDNYSFNDATELNATTYYRLKIVNKDNSITFSKIVTLKSDNNSPSSSLTIVQNPVASTLQFQYTATTTGKSKAVLYNASGVRVMTSDISLQKGSNALSINLDNSINQGTYFLEITNGTERTIAKLIKK